MPKKILSQIEDLEGRLDILVNNAGTNIPSSLVDTNINDFDYVMSLNVKSVISLTQTVIKKMISNNMPMKMQFRQIYIYFL